MNNLADSLNPTERKVLPLIKDYNSFREIVKKSKLKEVEVARAFQWLENKGLIKTTREDNESIDLDENGRLALREDLPEKKFLRAILHKDLNLNEIREKLSKDEFNVALGI